MTEKHIRCRNVPEDYRKLLAALEVELGDVSHAEALQALLDAYDEHPEMVVRGSDNAF
jgi:hypothetical protein